MEEDIEHLKELKIELENMSITGHTSEDRLNAHRKSLAISNILNELDRLQKENEELKKDNNHQWEERCRLTFDIEKNFISKDKIREKIKDLEDNMILFTNDKEKFNRYKYARDVLEKLLKEE